MGSTITEKCLCRDKETCKDINSCDELDSYIVFFQKGVRDGTFSDITDYSRVWCMVRGQKMMCARPVFAYRCRICGSLWLLQYPDFPSAGFIDRFSGKSVFGIILRGMLYLKRTIFKNRKANVYIK